MSVYQICVIEKIMENIFVCAPNVVASIWLIIVLVCLYVFCLL